jgi:hypothetical protein
MLLKPAKRGFSIGSERGDRRGSTRLPKSLILNGKHVAAHAAGKLPEERHELTNVGGVAMEEEDVWKAIARGVARSELECEHRRAISR